MSAVKSPEELSARDDGKNDKIVVEMGEAEELLPGWTKAVKIRKAGSRTKTDRYYTDPVSRYTFRSLKDVQRYLKTGKVGRLAIKPKDDNCVDMDVEEDRIFVPQNASNPSGEKIVEVGDVDLLVAVGLEEREETSESKEQIMVPSPLSETSRHKPPLEDGSEGRRTRSKSGEKSKPELPQRASKRLACVKVDAPLPSPPEPKTSQATCLAGIKIDAPPASMPEPKTRQATRLAGIKINAPPASPSESRTRQATRASGIKINASAWSPPEPKTRQATRLAGIEVDASAPLLPEPKTRQATRLAGIKVDASAPSSPEPKTRQATRLAGMEIDASPPSLPEPRTRQATRLAGIRVDASLPEPKTRQATRLAGIKIDSPSPSQPEPKTHRQATPRQAREAETRTTVNLDTPKKAEVEKSMCRGMQVDTIASSEVRLSTPVKCVREVTDKHDGNADMDTKLDHKQEIPILLPPVSQESREKVNKEGFKADEKQELHMVFPPVTPSTPKEHCKEIAVGPLALLPGSHTTPEEQARPIIVPPVNLETQMDDVPPKKQESLVNNPPVSQPIPQDSYGGGIKPESSVNFSMNDLWTDPCIEFAVKTLTGAIPFGELNKADNFPASPLDVPLEELWTDPCIEFAVKTLTGAIPIGEDLCVQDYMQHQPTSCSETRGEHSFSLPNVGMNNFCQTEVLSANHKQQNPAVPTLGNEPGNSVVPQQVKGSNGQCSRPRFCQ